MKLITFICLVLFAGTASSRESWLGKQRPKRFSSVAVQWTGNDVDFHEALDRTNARQAWTESVNGCGGVSRGCHVLESWGKYGCLVIYKGRSDRGNLWIGHSLTLLAPELGNGAMKYQLELANRRARQICDFHAHYDERGKIFDPESSFLQGYCRQAKVVCSEPLQTGEFE